MDEQVVSHGREDVHVKPVIEEAAIAMGQMFAAPEKTGGVRVLTGRVADVLAGMKNRVVKLGIPGLVVYNVVDGFVHAVPAYALSDGTVEEKVMTGGVVAGLAIVTNATFWLAVGLSAIKLREMWSRMGDRFSFGDEGGGAEPCEIEDGSHGLCESVALDE